MVTVSELCNKINMPGEVSAEVLRIAEPVNPELIKSIIEGLWNSQQSKAALEAIHDFASEDPRGLRKLCLCLLTACRTYEKYKALGIPEQVFFDTMGCFSRFVNEHMESFHSYGFDREWWTTRQLSIQLFRIGSIEYELRSVEGKNAISLHIPSDADLSESKCLQSYKAAKQFVDQFYPDYADCDWSLHTWLLCPDLKAVLPEGSKILRFQTDFNITQVDYGSQSYMLWVYKNKDLPLEQLPEHTSLQRNLKKYLLEGKQMGNGFGYLKKELYAQSANR